MQTKIERPPFEVTPELRERFEAKCLKLEDSCWVWRGAVNPSGYGAFKFDRAKHDAHVFSWRMAHHGIAVPVGKLVKHRCDLRLCVNPDHLEIGTSSENVSESYERQGLENGNAKLTAVDVRLIRRLFAGGTNKTDLARQFEVSRKTISDIVTGRSWRHA
jgi:hypothetical protein